MRASVDLTMVSDTPKGTMRAIVQKEYGNADVLQMSVVDTRDRA
jgi:hypothetical protein